MQTTLQDIKLETIDFKWINQTTKISHLKKAIRLIQLDGDYFKELKDACYDRIGQIDPTQKRRVFDNKMGPEMKAQIEKQLEEWANIVDSKQKKQHQIFNKEIKEQQIDPENYFQNQNKEVNKSKKAQNERVKGNQAIRSKDFTQALKYYTNSIQLDPSMYQTYGNRALAYIKIKQFQKALNDCQACLRINPKYTKAYHRKAKALLGLKNRVQAYKALQDALKIQPQNSQINGQLKELREEMSTDEKRQLEGGKGGNMKKIIIEEDSDEEMEEIA